VQVDGQAGSCSLYLCRIATIYLILLFALRDTLSVIQFPCGSFLPISARALLSWVAYLLASCFSVCVPVHGYDPAGYDERVAAVLYYRARWHITKQQQSDGVRASADIVHTKRNSYRNCASSLSTFLTFRKVSSLFVIDASFYSVFPHFPASNRLSPSQLRSVLSHIFYPRWNSLGMKCRGFTITGSAFLLKGQGDCSGRR